MARTVFANHMVAHVWAQQAQDEGRSPNGNYSFRGTVLYSYRTPIANIVHDMDGAPVALVYSGRYSSTTCWHQSYARSAMPRVFVVPHIGAVGGRYYDNLGDRTLHEANLDALFETYLASLKTAKRSRTVHEWRKEWQKEWAERQLADCKRYASAFFPRAWFQASADFEADWRAVEEYRAERDRKNQTPAAIARREKAAAERKRLTDLARTDRLEAWRQGANVRPERYSSDTALMRVKGREIQTSWGASFPVEHAKRAFAVLKALHDTGREFRRNGHTIHLGHFQVDAMDLDGTITAGCHTVAWGEVERCALALGLIPAEAAP